MDTHTIIIEDSILVAEMLTEVISREFDKESITISSVEQIFEASPLTSGLVLMDFYLDSVENKLNKNGVQIAKRVRCFNPNVPIVAITSSRNLEDVSLMHELNLIAYLNKNEPDFFDTLVEVISLVYRKKQAY